MQDDHHGNDLHQGRNPLPCYGMGWTARGCGKEEGRMTLDSFRERINAQIALIGGYHLNREQSLLLLRLMEEQPIKHRALYGRLEPWGA